MPRETHNLNVFRMKEELMAYFQTKGHDVCNLEKLALSELTNFVYETISDRKQLDQSGFAYVTQLENEHASQIRDDLKAIDLKNIFWPEVFCEYLNAEEKKKSHGEVFTPKDIVEFMLFRIAKHTTFKNKRVCDLASGNGAILYEIAKKYKSYQSVEGVDIQPFSARLSFVNSCLARPEQQEKISIRSFDSILNQELFSEPYDIIVSNPPYIGQKNNKELFEPLKCHKFWSEHYTSKSDYLYFFIIQSINMCSPGGIVCLITTQYWLTATKADKLRQYIATHADILEIHDFDKIRIFKNASGQENLIIILRKKNDMKEISKNKVSHFLYDNDWVAKNQEKWMSKKGISSAIDSAKGNKDLGKYNGLFELNLVNLTTEELKGSPWYFTKTLSDIKKKEENISLGDFLIVQPGIQTGSDKVNKKNRFVKENQQYLENLGINIGDGIYVLTKDEIETFKLNSKEKKIIKPFFKVGQINEFGVIKKETNYLIHVEFIDKIEDYPNIEKHLSKFKKILSCRFKTYALINNEKIGKWWKLVGARPDIPYEGEKILNPSRAKKPYFIYSNKIFYSSMDVFYSYQKNDESKQIPLKFVCAYLNSKSSKNYLERNCKKKGIKYELYKEPISNIPFQDPLNIDERDIELIAGIYSTKKKSGYEYYEGSGTWVKKAGLYDFALSLHSKINNISHRNSLKNISNLHEYTSNDMEFDDYGVLLDCFSALSKKDYEYLDLCVEKRRSPSKKYQLNLIAIDYVINKILEKY